MEHHVYALNDRYRGIHNGRRVVLVNPADIEALGLADGANGRPRRLLGGRSRERRAEELPRRVLSDRAGCAAAYFPETNVLVPLDSVADISNTPTSKGVLVRLVPADVKESTALAESVELPAMP